MDISSIGGSAMTPDVQGLYAVKCLKMSQQSTLIAGALAKCTAEMNASLERML